MLVLILVCLCMLHAYATDNTLCTDAPGCINPGSKAPLLCDTTNNVCYVHANVCNSLYHTLLSSIIYTGWTVAISTTAYNCSLEALTDCANPTSILHAPALLESPRFCIPINTDVLYSGISIQTIGHTSAIIYTPMSPAVDAYTSCAAFAIKTTSGTITFENIMFDMTNCAQTNPTTTSAILKRSGPLVVTSCTFTNTYAAIVLPGKKCSSVAIAYPNIMHSTPAQTATPILLIAACSGDITVTPTLQYTAIATTPYPNITGIAILNISALAAIIAAPAPVPPPPTVVYVHSDSAGIEHIIIPVSIVAVAIIVMAAMHAHVHKQQPHPKTE